ncbi:hypothetical protein MTR67_052761 [Solanum verrucosum]|uniref:Uncharacterized protein n=1 Tax=Solanum verrucosum TaxID=315347 RepID=A0AAF0V9K8_SOLVR|nr:hypothetical protein MTR67_052761 [Solanum verrucosum]
MVSLLKKIENFRGTSPMPDTIRWKYSSDGVFTANRLYKKELLGQPGGSRGPWVKCGTVCQHPSHYSVSWLCYLEYSEAARVQRFVDVLVGNLYNAVAPQMKTLTYSDADHARKIENKGLEEHAAYDVRKKAKTGGSFGGDFSANHRAGKATTGFSDRDRFVFTVCLEAAS